VTEFLTCATVMYHSWTNHKNFFSVI